MNENKSQWTYPVSGQSEDRSGARTNTAVGSAARLLGIDGRATGGHSPHPGFRFITQLSLGWNSTADQADNGHVKGWFPITFRISSSQYAYGFVYRAVNEAGTEARYRLYIRIANSLTWRTEQDFDNSLTSGLLSADEAFANEQMDVMVVGQFVYVARAGKPMFMFYLREGTQVEGWDLIVVESLGPGVSPILQNNLINGFDVAVRDPVVGPDEPHPDMQEVLTDIDPPATADAEARIVYVGMSGLVPVSSDGINFETNPNLGIRNADPSVIDKGVPGPGSLADEHGNVYWATPPQADPTWTDKAGTPTFPFPAPAGELTGWVWTGPNAANPTEPIANLGDNWVWAYRLYDSRTGRFSPLSNRIRSGALSSYGAIALFSDGTGYPDVTFPMFDVIWNSDRFDTVLIYRAIDDGSAVDLASVPLHLDSVITPEDYVLDTQPVSPWRRAAYFTQLSDAALEVQATFVGDDSFFVEPPRAGALCLYEGTMMYGKTATLNVEVGGLGLVFYSDLRRVNVELVPPLNRYPLRIANEEVGRFCVVGSNVVGLTRSNAYMFRKFNFDLQGFPVQKGYGAAGPRAATEVDSRLFFMNFNGLHIMTGNGALSEATAVHYIVFNEWARNWSNVHLAFDTTMGCIVMHNPELEHTVFLWERTNIVTELIDTVFIHAMEGALPDDETVAGSELLERAIFLQEVEGQGTTVWRVYTMDYDRRKGNVRLLDPTGDARFSVASMVIMTSVEVLGEIGDRLSGCYLYVLDGEHAGRKAKIESVTGQFLDLVSPGLPILEAGTRVGISPVNFLWVGHEIGASDPDSPTGTVWRGDRNRQGRAVVKQVDQIGCTFTDVSGDAAGDDDNRDARFAGAIYKGNNTDHEGLFFPVDPKGRGTKHESIFDGPSEYPAPLGDGKHGQTAASPFPAVSIFCPDLYYTLLEVRVTGTILASQREERAETKGP